MSIINNPEIIPYAGVVIGAAVGMALELPAFDNGRINLIMLSTSSVI